MNIPLSPGSKAGRESAGSGGGARRKGRSGAARGSGRSGPDPALLEGTAHVLRCLGHPLRLRILDLLERRGECTVTEVHETLDVAQAVGSQHLTTMWDKGILDRRKEGVHAYYRIGDERALKVLACVRGSGA